MNADNSTLETPTKPLTTDPSCPADVPCAAAPSVAAGWMPPANVQGGGWPMSEPGSDRGQTALIVGGVAAVVAVIPVIGLVGSAAGLVAVGLGAFATRRSAQRGQAIAGAVLGGVAVLIGVAWMSELLAGGAPTPPSDLAAQNAQAKALLAKGDYAQDDCFDIEFTPGIAQDVDYSVRDTCKGSTPGALMLVDAYDKAGKRIATGWADFEPLDPGRTYNSQIEFTTDVSGAAEFKVRDLDARHAVYNHWWDEMYGPTSGD